MSPRTSIDCSLQHGDISRAACLDTPRPGDILYDMTETTIPTELIERLLSARAVVVLTGAGISAESGVPTFRGQGGLWRSFRPEQLATPEAFARDPRTVWEWYRWRRELICAAHPNRGHLALAQWEKHFPDFALVTQNVDGLHRRAGSTRVFELHGNIFRSRCVKCGQTLDETRSVTPPVSDDSGRSSPEPQELPRCHCGGRVRPDVVWFGELLPATVLQEAGEAAAYAEVLFSVGTSGIVYPAAGLVEVARRAGAFTVEVNPEATEQSDMFDVTLRGASGEVLPAISARLGIQVPMSLPPTD
jgi:NAD-dependent deacetylase